MGPKTANHADGSVPARVRDGLPARQHPVGRAGAAPAGAAAAGARAAALAVGRRRGGHAGPRVTSLLRQGPGWLL